MPLLLYRYILSDLLRVFALTAAVLVTVIAFGATLKPLSDDRALTIGETLKYLVLATVPMLQFALPFAAGFASTLVFHRMSSDNEIVAAAASGISYRRLLAPVAGLGIVLMLVMVLLTQWAIPRFWNIMERMITADVTRLFEASINSGRPFQIGNLQIFADNMWVVPNPKDTGADTRLILSRMVAAELDGEGRVETDVTAHQAVVDIHRIDGSTYLRLAMSDAVAFDGGPGQLARVPQLEPQQAIVIPSFFRDQMRAMTRTQLLAIRANPDLHSRVAERRDALAEAMASAELWEAITEHLQAHGRLVLDQSGPSHRRYVVSAASIRRGFFQPADGETVRLHQYEGNTLLRMIDARQVRLSRTGSSSLTMPAFELELLDAQVTDMRGGATVNRREHLADHNLMLSDVQTGNLSSLSSSQLLEYAGAMAQPDAAVQRAMENLEKGLMSVDNEITARLLYRYTQSTTVLLLLLIGATLSMWLRGTLPLVIYVWAFAPSILALILISGGDKMIRDGNLLSGLAVMWSGNSALIILLAFSFLRLSRN